MRALEVREVVGCEKVVRRAPGADEGGLVAQPRLGDQVVGLRQVPRPEAEITPASAAACSRARVLTGPSRACIA